jgi:hypothetical protein
MVDYKKWDDMVRDLSDDEDIPKPKPSVTKLDAASRVTIDKSGVTIFTHLDESNRSESARHTGSKTAASKSEVPSAWRKNGGLVRELYYWSQTAREVALRVLLPKHMNTAAKNIKVSYHSDFESNRKLEIFVSSNILLSDHLKHEIIFEDVDEEDGLPWEIETLASDRYLTIIFQKKSLPGTTLWWDRVLINDPPIDVTQIEGRRANVAETKDLWEEAHRMFREKISQQKAQNDRYEVDFEDQES